jgi:hypothetical protein
LSRTVILPNTSEVFDPIHESATPGGARWALTHRSPEPLDAPEVGHVTDAPSGNLGVVETNNLRSDVQPHAALCLRIARMKEAHSSRWQKLLAKLPGKAQGKAAL